MIACRTTEKTPPDDVNPFLYIFAGKNKSKGKRDFTVSMVGDDPCLLTGLARLVERAGYLVQGFPSAADFLGQRETNSPGCVIIDLQSPDVDGFKLQAALVREELQLPVIFISGINDVLASVRVMKAGAFDVLPKPVDGRSLLSSISLAAERYAQLRREYEERIAIRRKFATLTWREIEVLRHVIAGRLNKQIAFELGVVEKTIKVHRSRVARKLGTRSVVDLVRLASTAGVTPYSSDNEGRAFTNERSSSHLKAAE
jgi:FixJ family two-component response regulator